ncbi:proton-conducting transporter membrane subunit [Pelosinus sp. sgz500959]|uniref:proton-conducting transporter transmembrane domain-containing protein n=1 Tax=Pelosinus sp. sgz500959 TaxID=3242472 RepID=UPI00366BA6D5
MIARDLYDLMLLLFSMGAVSVFFTSNHAKLTNYIAHSLALMGSALATLCAIFVFVQGQFTVIFPIVLPFGSIGGTVDCLSAFFLLIVGVVGIGTSIYAYGYSQEYDQCRLPLMAGLYNAFLLAMVLVLTVNHVVAFIMAWEVMSVASFFLVNHEYEKKVNTRSAYIYIVMTHIGTIFIITGFLLLAVGANSMDFSQLKGSLVSETLRNVIFVCVLIGFGTKAGMVPLHIWLPRAHPAAPSHISALMSAVMLKTAIYGMCRFFLDFLGVGPVWWGIMILLFAIITAVIGVLYAFIEHDSKRLLAYSSVENIGIILLGIGAGMVFMSTQQPILAGIAFAAALYHAFNHAIFKSLLFMVTGAVMQATHTKDIEKLGGLIKKMPYTAVFCLISSLAIGALPPLNGFVSEWLTFQSLLFLPQGLIGMTGKIVSALLIAFLGLTGALAAACFVNAFGMTFLAKPRSKKAEQAFEVAPSMLVAMGLFAVICVVLGLWPKGMLTILGQVFMKYPEISALDLINHDWYQITFIAGTNRGEFSTITLLLALVGGFILSIILYSIFGRGRVETGETWTCGIVPNYHMEYTATGFSKSIRMVFKKIIHSHDETLVDGNDHKYHGRKLFYHVHIRYLFVSVVYRPINELIIKMARFMKRIQTGSVQLYVGYIMVVTVLVLIWSTGW